MERTGIEYKLGNSDRMTCGIVSPVGQDVLFVDIVMQKWTILTDDDAKSAHACNLGIRLTVMEVTMLITHLRMQTRTEKRIQLHDHWVQNSCS
jgi:hypothetical protein